MERRKGKGPRTKKSGGHLFPENVSKSRRAFIHKQRCVATGAKTGEWVIAQAWMPETLKQLCPYKARIIGAHVDSRGAGNPDTGNQIPLEWTVHEWAGQIGWERFEKRVKLMSVREIAQQYEDKYLARCAAIAKNMEKKAE